MAQLTPRSMPDKGSIDGYKKRISDLQAKVAELEQRLVTDEFMQIFNRHGLMEYLESIAKEVQWQHQHPDRRRNVIIRSLSVVFLDIDFFKKVNDTYGHAAGDAVLQQVAALIQDEVRELDIVGRYGGEEIVIGLIGAKRADAHRVAEQLRGRIQEHNFTLDDGQTIRVTASLGVAELVGRTLPETIAAADAALYQAKTAGRNQVVIAESEATRVKPEADAEDSVAE